MVKKVGRRKLGRKRRRKPAESRSKVRDELTLEDYDWDEEEGLLFLLT